MLNTIFLQAEAEAGAVEGGTNPGMMNLIFIIGIIVVFYRSNSRRRLKRNART